MVKFCDMDVFLSFFLALGGFLNQFWEIFSYYFPNDFFYSVFFFFYLLEFEASRLTLSFSYPFSSYFPLFCFSFLLPFVEYVLNIVL